MAPDSPDSLESLIISILHSSRRWTRPDLQRRLVQQHGLERARVKAALDALIKQNEIAYTYQFGCSFLELSYNRPVRITDGIVIKPPACTHAARPADIVVNLMTGASFGSGRHPSTRLALNGLDYLFRKEKIITNEMKTRVLDIGTGSGILVIAAVKMGIDAGLGLDLDPCARQEARQNVRLNGLAGQIQISSALVETLASTFFLTLANLRWPTIDRLFPHLLARTKPTGYILLSGIKTNECRSVRHAAESAAAAKVVWQQDELEWSALAMKKRPVST